jgi:hypothetical protein
MSDKPTVSRGQRAVDAYIQGLTNRNELLPGAASYLAKRFSCSNPHGGLRALVGCLEHGDGKRYWNPEREPGRPESDLRKLVRRLAPAFSSGRAADDFFDAVALRFTPAEVEREPERVAEDLWDLAQDTFEHRSKLVDPPPLGRRQAKVMAALDALGGHLPLHLDRERIAEDYKDSADDGRPLAEVVRIVAARLARRGIIARELETGEVAAAARSAPAPADPDALRIEFAKLGSYEAM